MSNWIKVLILFEELLTLGHKDTQHDALLINIGKRNQFGIGFAEINPISKCPNLLARGATLATGLFETGAILVCLVKKTGEFLPDDSLERTEYIPWFFWQTGSVPYFIGGFAELYAHASEKFVCPINRLSRKMKNHQICSIRIYIRVSVGEVISKI